MNLHLSSTFWKVGIVGDRDTHTHRHTLNLKHKEVSIIAESVSLAERQEPNNIYSKALGYTRLHWSSFWGCLDIYSMSICMSFKNPQRLCVHVCMWDAKQKNWEVSCGHICALYFPFFPFCLACLEEASCNKKYDPTALVPRGQWVNKTLPCHHTPFYSLFQARSHTN